MVVLEAFLSSLFEVVLDKLMVSPLLEYARRLKVDTTLQDWKTTFLQIKSVLLDAEQRQIQNHDAVMGWLDDLKALACDIEDVLDEIDTEAKRCGLVQGPQTSTSKVRKFIPSFHHSSFNKEIGKKMKTISKGLDAIVKQKSVLGLREDLGGVPSDYTRDRHEGVPSLNQERRTTSLVTESEVFGRKADEKKIIELLLSDEVATAREVQVIPIVGMGGVGKTTLAQIIYNNKRVVENFQILGWVCVSDRFHLVKVTQQILESVSGRSSDSDNLQLLQQSLQKELTGKRFFLVLDDIWMEDPNKWSRLGAPLKGAAGSVVMVTTRSERVASIMRTTPIQPLSELSEEDCWSLFAHIAFENITPDARQNLEPIGWRIIEKCKGLPLAVKTLAGLLRCEQNEKAWEKMLNNEIWDLSSQQSDILPVLHLSYNYLPSKLKQCFAYCSIFPKDYEFNKEELILLWAAQSFLGGLKKGETIQDVGETCFDDLLSRSFFQPSGGYNKSLFVMHDLIHDLARFVSRNFCLRLEVGEQDNISERTRHVAYIREEFHVSKRFDPLRKTDKLRTFLPVSMPRDFSTCYLTDKVLRDLWPTFGCLRVLSLSYYNITHLPDSLENLKHLRYLNLSRTRIKRLPESIGMLLNLQSLVLSNRRGLIELPDEIKKLINLIHLDVSRTNIQGMPAEIGKLSRLLHLDISKTKLQGMPSGINKLKDLRRLTTFVVGKHSGARIAELRDLSHLRGALSILNLQNVVNDGDALDANLKKKEDLDDLVFAWDPDAIDGDHSENQTRVLDNLQPHTKVKRLSIQHYSGTKFPKWLEAPSLMNLVFLQLEDCKSCSSLPPLGQLKSLKDLQIVKMDEVRNVGAELYGKNGFGSSSIKPFGSLEILRFEEMLEWEEWVCCGVEFPCLKELYIKKCPKLKGDIPKCLPQLTDLEISECGQLVCRLPMAPSICDLKLDECEDVVVRSVGSHNSLISLNVRNVCKIPVELGRLHSLVELHVDHCPELKEMPPILRNLTSLEYLKIRQCKSLSSCSEMGLPPMLEILEIEDCPILESLPDGMIQNNTSLQQLSIKYCKKLELSLPQDITHNHHASLTTLKIVGTCASLTSFPLAIFTKLERLKIWSCANLECLYIPDGLHRLPTPNLRELSINDCGKLKSLPQGMHTILTSLQYLYIWNCPEIDSFPEGGLPANLSGLHIWYCNKLMACRMEWGLQKLLFLRSFVIKGHEEERLESFPEERFLPSTLTFLHIGDFPNLKSLDNKGLQDLTSLETLHIYNCEKLKSLPKQGLPSSLCLLYIEKCPLLKKRCQRDKGKEWPKISHIPCIVFDEDEENKEVILS